MVGSGQFDCFLAVWVWVSCCWEHRIRNLIKVSSSLLLWAHSIKPSPLSFIRRVWSQVFHVNYFAEERTCFRVIVFQFSSVQSLSRVRLFVTPWTAARQASLSVTNSQSFLKLMSIESVMPSSHLILCRPLLFCPQSFPASGSFQMSQFFAIRWPKYWSFSFSISPSSEYSGLISFRIDWLDLLAVQGALKSLLQYHSSKASILRRSAFFIVQLSLCDGLYHMFIESTFEYGALVDF